jgi:hypothetical protein
MQQAISEWWALPMGTAGKFYGDAVWNSAGTPPGGASGAGQDHLDRAAVDSADKSGTRTPVVPWYTSKWMSNPSCRGYPWY